MNELISMRERAHTIFFISFPLSLAECYKLQWHIAHDIRYTGMSICVCTTRDMASVSIWSSEISFFNFLCQFHSSFFLFLRLLIILKWFHLLSFDVFFLYFHSMCVCNLYFRICMYTTAASFNLNGIPFGCNHGKYAFQWFLRHLKPSNNNKQVLYLKM